MINGRGSALEALFSRPRRVHSVSRPKAGRGHEGWHTT
jgi:hypothetical protein